MNGLASPPAPFDAQFDRDPHGTWRWLRERAPVVEVRAPDRTRVWIATTHDAVRAVLTAADLSGSAVHAGPGTYQGYDLPPRLAANVINSDGAVHRRLRSLILPAFVGTRVRLLRPVIDQAVRQRVDALADAGGGDLVSQFAGPVHVEVVGRWLSLPEEVGQQYATWSQRLLDPAPAVAPRARDGLAAMQRMVDEVLGDRDVGRGDGLLARLVGAHQSGSLTGDELASMVFYLLFVWHEVGVNAVANAAGVLLQQATGLRTVLVPARQRVRLVEELLRHEPPQMIGFRRYAVRATTICGVRIPAGSSVVPSIAGANRDPGVFDDPDGIDPSRWPNPHLTFGHGSHACPAAGLARELLTGSLQGLAARVPDARAGIPVQMWGWRPGMRNRGVRTLPIIAAG